MRVLVTGGAGFIGSNLANHLSEENDVIVIDDCSLGTPENLKNGIEFHERSVVEEDLPTDVDIVFHLAALSSLQMYEDEPVRGTRVNVEGFVNVVQQAIEEGCENVVYASTSSIYGTQTEASPEEMDVSVNTGYEASKLAREKYAEYFSNYHNIPIAGVRFFSVYQGFSGNEEHKQNYANVISQFAESIYNGESPVLYGDGKQTRDFTHVNDVVRAMELLAEEKSDGIYNIGTGNAYTFNQVVELINDAFGKSIEPEYIENPIDDDIYVHDTCADTTRIEEEVGWEPEIGLEEGVKNLCDSYQKRLFRIRQQ